MKFPARFRGGAFLPRAGGANRCAIPPAAFHGEGDSPSPHPSPVGASRRRVLPGLSPRLVRRPGRRRARRPGRARASAAALCSVLAATAADRAASEPAPTPASVRPQSGRARSADLDGQRIAFVAVAWADGSSDPVPEEASRLVSLHPGDTYRALAVRQSVKQIFSLGRFRDVRVEAALDADGNTGLRFLLDPLPRVREFEVRGAPPGLEQQVGEALGVETGAPVPDAALAQAAAEERLRGLGYLDASVRVEVEPVGGDAVVEAVVEPGLRARVGSFRVETAPEGLTREITDRLEMTPGRVWSETEFVERLAGVRRLLREGGYLLADLDFAFHREDPSLVEVVLLVETGPEVVLEVLGFPGLGEGAQIALWALTERRITDDALEGLRQQQEALLVADGFRDAAVRVERFTSDSDERLTVRLTADPGPRYTIGSVTVEGLAAESAPLAEAALGPLREGRVFREEEWAAATGGLRRRLLQAGHYRAEVSTSVTPRPDDPTALDLTARVRPGPAATIGSVRFEGAARDSPEELRQAAMLSVGMPFVAETVVGARETLETRFRNRGFLDAVVEVEAPVDPATRRAEVVFHIRAGDFLTVGEVIVAGLAATSESFLRARLPFREGDPLSTDDLVEVRHRLVSMGIFRTVEVVLLEPEESVNERNVLIRVEESSRTSVGYGAGYSEREQLRGEVEWARRNLFGRSHTLSLFARLSVRGSRMIATYRGAENAAGTVPLFVSAYREAQDREGFDFVRTGVGVQLSRRVFGRNLFLRYDFTTNELSNLKIHPNQLDRNFAESLWLSAVSASVVEDTRDDPVNPGRGRFGIVDLKWSAALLGSRAPFVKALGQQFFYVPLGGRVVLAAALRLGAGWTLGEGQQAQLPLIERFFAGGATTLRGFRLDRAGPLDRSGYPLGGNLLAVGNLEVRFPIFGSLGGALFSDHGGVYAEVAPLQDLDWNHNAGLGLRWATPLGPVRFDYAFRLGDIGGLRRRQWHFTIGHAF